MGERTDKLSTNQKSTIWFRNNECLFGRTALALHGIPSSIFFRILNILNNINACYRYDI